MRSVKVGVTLKMYDYATYRPKPLAEIAPGIDIERDILAHMDFKPIVKSPVPMDPRIFRPGLMGLSAEIHAKPRGYRSERVARWHETRRRAAT